MSSVLLGSNIWQTKIKKNPKTIDYHCFRISSCDLDRIQTCNLLSRNQVRYSVAPRGLFKGANITAFGAIAKTTEIIYRRSGISRVIAW
jgi:hypothetical protein